jgi:hypothetical protein
MAKMNVADLPARALVRKVPQWDNTDPEKPTPLPDKDEEATYAWLFATDPNMRIGRRTILADDDPFTLNLKEDEDPGEVVGYLAKVDPRDGAVKWAGPESCYEVCQKVLDKWVAARILLEDEVTLARTFDCHAISIPKSSGTVTALSALATTLSAAERAKVVGWEIRPKSGVTLAAFKWSDVVEHTAGVLCANAASQPFSLPVAGPGMETLFLRASADAAIACVLVVYYGWETVDGAP